MQTASGPPAIHYVGVVESLESMRCASGTTVVASVPSDMASQIRTRVTAAVLHEVGVRWTTVSVDGSVQNHLFGLDALPALHVSPPILAWLRSRPTCTLSPSFAGLRVVPQLQPRPARLRSLRPALWISMIPSVGLVLPSASRPIPSSRSDAASTTSDCFHL